MRRKDRGSREERKAKKKAEREQRKLRKEYSDLLQRPSMFSRLLRPHGKHWKK